MTRRSKRALSILGTVLIADGSTFLANPRGLLRLGSSPSAPRFYRRMMAFCEEHVRLWRVVAAAEIAAGVALLRRVGD